MKNGYMLLKNTPPTQPNPNQHKHINNTHLKPNAQEESPQRSTPNHPFQVLPTLAVRSVHPVDAFASEASVIQRSDVLVSCLLNKWWVFFNPQWFKNQTVGGAQWWCVVLMYTLYSYTWCEYINILRPLINRDFHSAKREYPANSIEITLNHMPSDTAWRPDISAIGYLPELWQPKLKQNMQKELHPL